MQIEGMRTLAGPNVYTHRPALVMRLDLRELAGRETREFEGFDERLLAALPGLGEHHCSKGHADGFVERLREGTYFGRVVEATGAEHAEVLTLSEVPVTLCGTAEFQSANVLACVAACRAPGVAREAIAAALATFSATADNPGRTNIFRLPAGGHAVLDYGRNPEAFAAVCQAAARWHKGRVTGIVGVPGDRSDELVEQAARIAARGFGRLVVKEDKDLRGRRPGEVAAIIRRAAGDEAPWLDCSVVLCEEEALRQELKRLGGEEVVVMFYDKLEPLRRVLAEFGAEPVETIEGLAPRAESKAASAADQAAPADTTAAPLVGVRRPNRAARHSPAQDWHGLKRESRAPITEGRA
jgi:hypothetical protein